MDISDLETVARLADAITSTAVLLIALIWQARQTVALSDRINEIHREHKRDLRNAGKLPASPDDDD